MPCALNVKLSASCTLRTVRKSIHTLRLLYNAATKTSAQVEATGSTLSAGHCNHTPRRCCDGSCNNLWMGQYVPRQSIPPAQLLWMGMTHMHSCHNDRHRVPPYRQYVHPRLPATEHVAAVEDDMSYTRWRSCSQLGQVVRSCQHHWTVRPH